MISIDKALLLIQEHSKPTDRLVNLGLSEAVGHVLARDQLSPIHIPPFRQSAMDGYALNLAEDSRYKLIGEVKAGDSLVPDPRPGEAVRIFTGAMLPKSANAVVMQEKATAGGEHISLNTTVKKGDNIRPQGEQLIKGQMALTAGTKLSPAGVGLLASLGLTRVMVLDKPSVGIIVTGNELLNPGQVLEAGKIYESNSAMLRSALSQSGYKKVTVRRVQDDYQATLETLNEALSTFDLTIISGGISVGDYDFVAPSLGELEVEQHFYKVRQKPGKPLYFGSKGSKLVFALPGNPAASLSCFYLYVLPALEQWSGNMEFRLNRCMAECSNGYTGSGDRPQFLKAIYTNGKVEILDGQNSSMIHTFAQANALVFKPAETQQLRPGDLAETILLL